MRELDDKLKKEAAAAIAKVVAGEVGGEGAKKGKEGDKKDAKSEDFFILSWHCGVDKQCTGDIINGTGRFEGATGVWKWWNDTGWGEGGGTLLTK